MTKKEKAAYIVKTLEELYPETPVPLIHKDPYTLMIAVLLSAQCTDERVNIVTKPLFKKYKTPADFVKLTNEQLEKEIYSTGFYKQKAKSIKVCCDELLRSHKGKVPADFDELVKLSGVGRKTAG